jgi:hypothetical protein
MAKQPMKPRPEDVAAISALKLAQLRYPGPLIRPIPSFTMGVPQGWLVRECPGAMFAMGPADGVGPWANVIVRHDRVIGDVSLADVAATTLVQLQADYPDVEVLEDSAVAFQLPHYVRSSRLTMAGWDGVVGRSDSFVFGPEPAGNVVDLFHIVWMSAFESAGPYAELFAAMMASFEYTDESADGTTA